MKNKFYIEILYFVFLLFITVVVLYNTNPVVQTIFFLITLLFFWKSNKDYFWLAYVLILLQDVGGIFIELTDNIITIGPIPLSYFVLFTLIAFFKEYRKKSKVKFLFIKPLKVYLFYLFFLMYLGFLIYGNDGGGKSGWRYYLETFFLFIFLLNLYIVPRILNSMDKIEFFIKLIFVGLIINLLGQIFHIFNGVPIYVKYGQILLEFRELDFSDRLIRPVWGHTLILLGISSAMLFYLTKNKNFKPKYLLLIILICLISVFIGATRGWIIALTFSLIGFLFYNKITNSLSILLFSGIFLVALFISNDGIRIHTSQVLKRLTTLEKLVEGDPTAGGTNVRLTDRNDKVMKVFYQYPIFGKGFSTEAMEKNDIHVGNQNILMSGGVIGYLIITYFWIYFIYTTYKISNTLSKKNEYYPGLIFIPIIFFTTFLIHSTSTSLYGYLVYVREGKLFFIIIFFTILNQFLLKALEMEKSVIEK